MKTKKIVAVVSILLASCAAVAADSPFEKGKTYKMLCGLNYTSGSHTCTVEIKDIKDKWILINNEEICRNVESNECWYNTDLVSIAVQVK